jgi:uncharacterized protein DUF6962
VSEVIVGVTDYLLMLECAVFALVLAKTGGVSPDVRRLFALFFSSLALTSLTGGTYHVWFSGSSSVAADILWKATVAALGAAALAAWAIGACLLFAQSLRRRVIKAAVAEFFCYAIYTAAVDDRFLVAIANYVPAAMFLAAAFALGYRRRPAPPVMVGLAGLIVTGIAAAIQRSEFSLHPYYFNYNASYHLVQAVGFFLIFVAARFLIGSPLYEGSTHE